MRVALAGFLLALATLGVSGTAWATSIAREPLRQVLRSASPDVAACARRHRMPEGRYTVRLVVDELGKVTEVTLGEVPGDLTPATTSCVEAAYSHLRFPAQTEPAPPARPGRTEPVSHLPAPGPAIGIIVISWPFVLVP